MDATTLLASALLAFVTFLLGIATNWLTSRRTLAMQYDADLRRDRLRVYMDLWSRLEGLNKYARTSPSLSRVEAEKLAIDLKQWYFQAGGLYLSEPARNDYFALQDALQHAMATTSIHANGIPAAFEFVRVCGSRLRTSLTRDVGTRKTLKLRGDPERPPSPSELGRYRREVDGTEITLTRGRWLRIGRRRSVVVRRPSGGTNRSWTDMQWDRESWSVRALHQENGRRHRRQLLLEPNRLVEGPTGWDPTTQEEQPPPVIWSRVPADDKG